MSTVQSGIATSFINFSRSSNATVVDVDGTVKWAPHNLLTNSESFDSTNWSKTSSTISANSLSSPNNTITADTITASGANATVLQSYIASNAPTTFGIWIKRKTGTGNIQIAADSGTYTTVDITSSWALYTVTQTPSAGSASAGIKIVTSGDEVYVWGAHLYRSDLNGMQPNPATPGDLRYYNPTTPKNLLGYTETLTTGWTNTNTTETVVTEVNPNGLVGVAEITATASNGTLLSSLSLLASPYTFSIWLKRKTGVGTVQITVDGSTYVTASVTSDWQRFSTTLTPSAGTKTPGVKIVTSGDAVHAWGAQLSDSASLDSYSPNHFGAPISAAYYAPRRDFDPVTKACKGLLVEGQRTNILVNSDTLSTQTVDVLAVPHTLSFYGTGTITLSGASTAGPLVGTGAFPNKVSLTFTPTAGTLTLTVSGSVTYAQLELGSFATSYIPTKTSSVSRAADISNIATAAIPYNLGEGTLVAAFTPITVGSTRNVVQLDDGTWNDRITLGTTSTPNGSFVVVDNGTSQASITTGTPSANTNIKLATRFATNDFAMSANGAVVATDTSGSVPTVNTLQLAVNEPPAVVTWDATADTYTQSVSTEEILNGWVRQITYMPRKLSNAELQGKSV